MEGAAKAAVVETPEAETGSPALGIGRHTMSASIVRDNSLSIVQAIKKNVAVLPFFGLLLLSLLFGDRLPVGLREYLGFLFR